MPRTRRPSAQTTAVLRALAENPDRWRYGYDLCAQLGIQAGSMYPILIRLADRGLLETSWEAEPAPGKPPRHLYRLTGDGRALAATVTVTASGAVQGTAPRPGLAGA
jgi:PadR family transcriptional regulator, regulatory protein PadR